MRRALLLPLLLLLSLPAYAQTPTGLELTVYEDGAVRISYTLSVDPTYPAVNITLLGQTFEDLLIVDESSMPLGYSISGNVATVNTLGASSVKITYSTHDLTSKVGRLWSLNFTSPTSAKVVLPSGASVISLSSIPESIAEEGGRVVLVMPKGHVEVAYVLEISGTKDYALVAISSARDVINNVKARGFIVGDAERLLSQAEAEFKSGNYARAAELAMEAEGLAKQINATASKALAMMLEVERALKGVESGAAKELLDRAKAEFERGNYGLALSLAEQAMAKVEEASQAPPAFPYWAIALAAIVAIVLAVVLLKRPRKYSKEVREVDLEKIFKERPGLRPEDREVIEFLAEAGGEAFESEIRERFKLPRTTAWRMVKRLEREGIVEVRKVGGQNLIRVKAEFCK